MLLREQLGIGTKEIVRGEKNLSSLKCPSYLFLRADADVAEYLANSFKEWIAEGMDVDGVDAADALNLNQEALDARYNRPDVQEGENGKVNAPDECHWDAEDRRQQAVKPIFCHSEGGEAGLPDAVETVCPFWFCNHIFKVNLDHVVVEMLGVAVDQVNLLGVRVIHLLLSHLVCHGLVVGLVDVALFPDGNSVEMSLGVYVFAPRHAGAWLAAGSEEVSLGCDLRELRKEDLVLYRGGKGAGGGRWLGGSLLAVRQGFVLLSVG